MESGWKTFKTLTFGGLLGAVSMGLVFIVFFDIIRFYLNFQQCLILGSVVGSIASKVLERVVNGIGAPLFKIISYYEGLLELEFQLRGGWIHPEEARSIKRELDRRYFLGNDKILPPIK